MGFFLEQVGRGFSSGCSLFMWDQFYRGYDMVYDIYPNRIQDWNRIIIYVCIYGKFLAIWNFNILWQPRYEHSAGGHFSNWNWRRHSGRHKANQNLGVLVNNIDQTNCKEKDNKCIYFLARLNGTMTRDFF